MDKCFFKPSHLASLLREGSPAIFPTDTLPALAAKPSFAYQIWDIKNREPQKPLILMGASLEDLFEFVALNALNDALKMAGKYWPGALTMVLPSSDHLIEQLNPSRKTIGMRVPNCSMAQNLLSMTGPLATTSANISGQDPILCTKDLIKVFPQIPLLAPLNWPQPSEIASSVILWEGEGTWQLIRRGAVIPDECQ